MNIDWLVEKTFTMIICARLNCNFKYCVLRLCTCVVKVRHISHFSVINEDVVAYGDKREEKLKFLPL